jgi:hypothetical protein
MYTSVEWMSLCPRYADDLFNIFYRMEPRAMVREGFAYGGQGRRDFQEQYGVLETVEKIEESDNACSRATKKTVRVLRKPGASPLLFGKFLMNTTAFLALEDISDNLPRYDENVISVDMDDTLQKAYEQLEEDIRSAMKEHRGNKSLMSILLNTLLLYPDHPYDFDEIWARAFDPQTKEYKKFLVTVPENLTREALYAKERALIADVKEELRQGRRCQVYATYTGEKDVTERLEAVLGQEGKLDELRMLAGQIRQYFYKITLPWSDEGFRLLPANFYFDLMARMREFETSFEQGVESFLRVYPQYIEQVKPELNGLFREEDYPVAEKLRAKFGLKVEILPIPTGADFRVQMSAEEQARVSSEIEANVRGSLTRGTEDLWRRVREAVAHMVDRLNEPESRFHSSLVTNVLDIVEILPQLNVNGDADLNRFADQIKERLCNYSAQDLKKHDLLRVSTAADAANIVAEMDDVLRGREAAETVVGPTADDIFTRMSAFMEAPAAV